VDWIENPPPDAIPFLHKGGYTVATSPMPNVWAYYLRVNPQSPFRDVRVRQAINYAMDREGIVTLLNGAAQPARGFWKPGDARFGHPANDYRYDPARAKALLPRRVTRPESCAGEDPHHPHGAWPDALPADERAPAAERPQGWLRAAVRGGGREPDAALYNHPKAPRMAGVTAVNKGYNTGEMTYLYAWFLPAEPRGLPRSRRQEADGQISSQLRSVEAGEDPGGPERTLRGRRANGVGGLRRQSARLCTECQSYTPAQSWYTDLTTIYMTG